MSNNLQELAIEKLTRLLIEQEIKDKKNHKVSYVKKTQAYKDLIKLVKDVWYDELR